MPFRSPILVFLGASAAAAQDMPAPSVGTIQQEASSDVVIVGQGLLPCPGDAAFAVVEIGAERIAENAANRLESVLADVAGLQQFRRSDSRSANPTSQGIALRGIGGNASSRAALVLDGVPQADPFGGWVPFPAYAADRVALIRVTRGGGSGYLGAGALAGAVEIESAGAAGQPAVRGSLARGSRDSLDVSASALLTAGDGFATISTAYTRGDGFIPIVEESRGLADRAAPFEQASVAVRGVLRVMPAVDLQTNVTAFTDTRERGTAFTRNRSEGADASLRLIGRGRWRWSALAYLQTRAFASQFASIDPARTRATQTLDQYNTPATGTGGRLELLPPIGAGRDLRLGLDARRVEGRTQEAFTFVEAQPTRRRVAGGEALTWGAFADASAHSGQWTVTAGGRLDQWQLTGGVLRETTLATGAPLTGLLFADREGTEWTGRAGLAWSPDPLVTMRAAAYRGWRLPTLNELYRPFRVGADAVAANAALAPERLSGIEGGLTIDPGGGMTLAATVFHNRLNDAIANVGAGRGPGNFPGVGFVGPGGIYRVRQNLDAIRSTGIEIDARWRRGPLFASASWSHVDPEVVARDAAAALDGLRPAQTPRDLVSVAAGWRSAGASFSATVRHAGRQFEDDQNTRVLASATTLDGVVAWPLTRSIGMEVRAENVFDERVEAGISGADVVERATPRTVWLGVKLRLE